MNKIIDDLLVTLDTLEFEEQNRWININNAIRNVENLFFKIDIVADPSQTQYNDFVFYLMSSLMKYNIKRPKLFIEFKKHNHDIENWAKFAAHNEKFENKIIDYIENTDLSLPIDMKEIKSLMKLLTDYAKFKSSSFKYHTLCKNNDINYEQHIKSTENTDIAQNELDDNQIDPKILISLLKIKKESLKNNIANEELSKSYSVALNGELDEEGFQILDRMLQEMLDKIKINNDKKIIDNNEIINSVQVIHNAEASLSASM